MTFNNSILIIIKQFNGIDYNELFLRISSRYKNNSSAHSALSRALKNLSSFGLIKKQENQYYITDKGLASISIEMKEKLVLKLNEIINKPIPNIQEIVQLLIVLTQRSSQDNDLLLNAKENASFTINDIEKISKEIIKQRLFLKQMNLLLKKQKDRLQELDFNDSREVIFDGEFARKVISFSNGEKIVFEFKDKSLLEEANFANKKVSEVIVEGDDIQKLIDILLDNSLTGATIYIPKVRIKLSGGKAKVFSYHRTLENFFSQK